MYINGYIISPLGIDTAGGQQTMVVTSVTHTLTNEQLALSSGQSQVAGESFCHASTQIAVREKGSSVLCSISLITPPSAPAKQTPAMGQDKHMGFS